MAYVDRRILHVATIYSNYEMQNPTYLLYKIHEDLKQKFSNVATGKAGAGSRKEAQILQEFFQDIKQISDPVGGQHYADQISDIAKRQVLQEIVEMSLKVSRFKTLFRSVADSRKRIWWQGAAFEKQLNAVIASTLQKASSGSFDNKTVRNISTKQIAMGSKGAGLGSEMVDYLASQAVKGIAADFNGTAQKKHTRIDKYTTEIKSGKIDSSGLMFQGEISASPSSYLGQIAKLLSKANFTAKSYASQKEIWDRTQKAKIEKMVNNAYLHLGSTNQARIYLPLLSAYLPAPVALSAYMYIINTSNAAVQLQAARLRFIYELTGYGQVYQNGAIQQLIDDSELLGANYIIYNDPATDDIFVRSTADIIAELWDNLDRLISEKSVKLEKSLFK